MLIITDMEGLNRIKKQEEGTRIAVICSSGIKLTLDDLKNLQKNLPVESLKDIDFIEYTDKNEIPMLAGFMISETGGECEIKLPGIKIPAYISQKYGIKSSPAKTPKKKKTEKKEPEKKEPASSHITKTDTKEEIEEKSEKQRLPQMDQVLAVQEFCKYIDFDPKELNIYFTKDQLAIRLSRIFNEAEADSDIPRLMNLEFRGNNKGTNLYDRIRDNIDELKKLAVYIK